MLGDLGGPNVDFPGGLTGRKSTDPVHPRTGMTHRGKRVKNRWQGRFGSSGLDDDEDLEAGFGETWCWSPKRSKWRGFDGEMSSHAEHVMTSRIVGLKAPVGKLPFYH